MSFMTDIPFFYCYVRSEFLYNLESHHRELIPCCVFAVDSVEGHAIGFDIMTDFGGQFARLPIHALCWKVDASPIAGVWTLELWNNFSYDVEAHEYGYLRQMQCEVRLEGKWHAGEYMFTLSWFGSQYAEQPGEGGFKRAHIIKLECGLFAAQPNNRIRWFEPSFITKPFPERPDFLTNSHVWNAERRPTHWSTENSNRFFYEETAHEHQSERDRGPDEVSPNVVPHL